MGSPVSVVVAEIVMQNIEEQALASYKRTIPLWLRYVDDTFTTLHKDEIDDFHKHLNRQNAHIQFTKEDNGKIPFLDCLDICDNNRLQTTVYRKPTHTDSLLDESSYNPTSHKATTIRTLTRRALLVCDSHDSLADEHKYLDNVFSKNNYNCDFVQNVGVSYIAKLFTDVSTKDIDHPTGEIEVLIGYQYAAYHPQREQNIGHLLLLKNQFGKCIGGSHNLIRDETQLHTKFEDARVHYVNTVSITNLHEIENLGIECEPRCGGCKRGKCAIGSNNYTLQEEREVNLIQNNLEYDKKGKRWIAEYPWIKDQKNLPDNERVAIAKLISTENRLERNAKHAEI